MYKWRKMTDEERRETMNYRRLLRYPMHSPPHFNSSDRQNYHLSAANFEHAVIIGKNHERLAAFTGKLCETLSALGGHLHAWCVLPNHWHALVNLADLKGVLALIGKLHGKSSFGWNREDAAPGRKCWHCCTDRQIRSESHFFAVRNYIHHNPVKHGYTAKWDEWPFSSAKEFLDNVGMEKAAEYWENYPVLDMGQDWDRD